METATLTRVERANEMLESLAALGSPDAIAAKMYALDIKGECRSPNLCVVAQYLYNELGGVVSLGPNSGFVGAEGDYNSGNNLILPYRVTEFIRAFDRQQYPQLIATAALV